MQNHSSLGNRDRKQNLMVQALRQPYHWEFRLLDFTIQQWRQSATLDAAFIVIADWTPLLMLLVIFISSFGVGLSVEHLSIAKWTAMAAILTGVLARVCNEPISRWVNRKRPFEWYCTSSLTSHSKGQGFPSNHATGAFALAISMYGIPGYGGILVGLAALLSVSRIYTGLHFTTDVVAGALHGTLVALVVHRLFFLFMGLSLTQGIAHPL